jgi:Transmembrane protein 43
MSRRRIVGIGLVLAALVLHFWNARRDAHPRSYAETAVAPADRIDPSLSGRVVSVTGPLETTEILADPKFAVSGRWIRLVRTVEMYCWLESIEGNTLRYTLGWTETPHAWRQFRQRSGRSNPSMAAYSEDRRQPLARIGPYRLSADLARLPEGRSVPLAGKTLTGSTPPPEQLDAPRLALRFAGVREPTGRLDGDYFFLGTGSVAAPEFGDVRISWKAFEPGTVFTVFGEQRDDELVPHVTDDGGTLWWFQLGPREIFAPRPALERWGLVLLASVLGALGLVILLGREPVPVAGGLLGLLGMAIVFFVWPLPATLLAGIGVAAIALRRLASR